MEDCFTETIEVSQPPPVVFARLKDVSRWWGGADLAGRTAEAGDEFTIIHGDAHYSKQRVMEVVPDSRIVWKDSRVAKNLTPDAPRGGTW